MCEVFFGYPNQPPVVQETLARAAGRVRSATGLDVKTWQDLRIGGRYVVAEILNAITTAELCVFEITSLNPNVLFELGYAVARGKRVWLLRDDSVEAAAKQWDHFKLLIPVGYRSYVSSDDIRSAFLRDRPLESDYTIYDHVIEANLAPPSAPTIVHFRSPHSDDADRSVARRISSEKGAGLRVITIDPSESTVDPLAWYSQQLHAASAVVIHFTAPRRLDAAVFNARYSFLAGLAAGFERPLLMLAEEDFFAPFDYRHLLRSYRTASALSKIVDPWLTSTLGAAYEEVGQTRQLRAAKQDVEKLKSLDFGEHLAENEADDLWAYFVETAAYRSAVRSTAAIFEGRKGAGKTANFLRAAAELQEDRRNLVCLVQPLAYDLDAVVRLIRNLGASAIGGFVLESLWKLMIYSEIAVAATDELRLRPPYTIVSGSTAWDFLDYMSGPGRVFEGDFALRLERALGALESISFGDSFEKDQIRVGEALHAGPLRELRGLLGPVLKDHHRVAVLIDNLDKAWHRDSDLDLLSRFILGLVESTGPIVRDFARDVGWRTPVPVSLAVFIRSDILVRVRRMAREPDKLPVETLEWSPELLRRVLEERYQALQDRDVPSDQLWDRFFCERIGAYPTRDFILARVLARPRDLLYYCKTALSAAINRRHGRIEADDLAEADAVYSQFAVEAVLLEARSITANGEDLESVLYEFAGGDATLTSSQAEGIITRAGIPAETIPDVVRWLRDLGILGIEIEEDHFDFSETLQGQRRADALNAGLFARLGMPSRYRIRAAYCPYLGLHGDPLSTVIEGAKADHGEPLF